MNLGTSYALDTSMILLLRMIEIEDFSWSPDQLLANRRPRTWSIFFLNKRIFYA